MFDQLLSTMRVIALPMKTEFRGISLREVALFKGPNGWGEFSPFLEYDDQESSWWLASAIEAATKPLPVAIRRAIPINGTIPATNDEQVIADLVSSYQGAKTYKVKVGKNLSEDLLRLARIRSLGREINIRIDVNGAWSVEEALANLSAMYNEIGPFEYVEQPCATLEELRELKSKIQIPVKIAADEVIRKSPDPFALDLKDAADIVMLKVQPLGGIQRSLEIAAHHKLPVVVSSALESAVGIHYGLALASSLKELPFACGLATGALMQKDIASIPVVDGSIHLTELAIHLDGFDVPAERYDWWKNRAMRCYQVLENQ